MGEAICAARLAGLLRITSLPSLSTADGGDAARSLELYYLAGDRKRTPMEHRR